MVAERLQADDVFWMEEPLHRGDYDGMTELRRRVRAAGTMRIAGGEMTREPYEFRELLQRDCLDVFQPDCVCSQGISGLAGLAREVAAAGKVFTPHTWGNGIGVLANLHLIAGTVGHEGSLWVEWPFDPPEWTLAASRLPVGRRAARRRRLDRAERRAGTRLRAGRRRAAPRPPARSRRSSDAIDTSALRVSATGRTRCPRGRT